MEKWITAAKVILIIAGFIIGKKIPWAVRFFSKERCCCRWSPWAYAGLNGILYAGILCLQEFGIRSMLYGIVVTALLTIAVIDWKINEIPNSLIVVILLVACAQTAADWPDIGVHIAGFFLMSLFLAAFYFLTAGQSLGGGDVKLMAAAGLLLGWEKAMLALFAGGVLALAFHSIRRKKRGPETTGNTATMGQGQGDILAFGPYLAAGVILQMLIV